MSSQRCRYQRVRVDPDTSSFESGFGATSAFVGRREALALRLLFICTGNICRSPTAERLAAAYASEHQIPDLVVSSAGVHAVIGHSIHRDAAAVIEWLGGSSSDFAARQLTPRIACDADLILTMTASHRDSVLELAPHKLHRTFMLSEAARIASDFDVREISEFASLRSHVASGVSDVLDPIGERPEFFTKVGTEIAGLLTPVLALCHRALG